MEEKRAIKWIWRMPCSRSGRRVPGFTQVHICNIPPAYETFLGTLIMVLFLLSRIFEVYEHVHHLVSLVHFTVGLPVQVCQYCKEIWKGMPTNLPL